MVNLQMCGGRVEVSSALRTRMDVAIEFCRNWRSDRIERGSGGRIVAETPMPQPAPPRSQR